MDKKSVEKIVKSAFSASFIDFEPINLKTFLHSFSDPIEAIILYKKEYDKRAARAIIKSINDIAQETKAENQSAASASPASYIAAAAIELNKRGVNV